MKRGLGFLSLILMAAGLAACGSNNSNNATTPYYCTPGTQCLAGPPLFGAPSGPVHYTGVLTNVDSGRAKTISDTLNYTLFSAGTTNYNTGTIDILAEPAPNGTFYTASIMLGGGYSPFYGYFAVQYGPGNPAGGVNLNSPAAYFPIGGGTGSQLRMQVYGWKFDIISSSGVLDGSQPLGAQIPGVEIQWTEVLKQNPAHLASTVLIRQ